MPLITAERASQLLLAEEVVALPTETVYGLAGRIDSDSALKKIFATKARPLFDPLIVHVQSVEQAKELAQWDSVSLALAKNFWPGPLTIVLPKKEKVSSLITSGGSTVAMRMPDHPLFRKVLTSVEVPLAAPSANRFGHTSPTQAQHVVEEFNDQIPVVDGGECARGIESTVVEWESQDNTLKILRPGVVTQKALVEFLIALDPTITVAKKEQNNSPGFLQNHYQPTVPLLLVTGLENSSLPPEILIHLKSETGQTFREWKLHPQANVAARTLYKDLREFSKAGQAIYLIMQGHWQVDENWSGMLDRLQKASHGTIEITGSHWQLKKKNNSLH